MGNFISTTSPSIPISTQPFNLIITDEYNLIDNNKTYILVLNDISFTNYTISEPSQVTFTNVVSNIFGTIPFEIYESPSNIYNSSLNIDAVCYAKGTKILCLINEIEQYVNIEDIKEDTLIKTYLHGYKKIKILGKTTIKNTYEKKINKIYKMSKEKDSNLIDDLYVTGQHSLLVDSLTPLEKTQTMTKWKKFLSIDDKQLLMAWISNKFEDVKNNNIYELYQIILEHEKDSGRYGIWANGILSETMSMETFKNKKKLLNSYVNIENELYTSSK
jgi:hypothetical protein